MPVCLHFPNPKITFWNHKKKTCVWWSLKNNFLEKVMFWKCEGECLCTKAAIQSIFQKPVRVHKSYHWTIPNFPSHFIENVMLPFDKSTQIPHSSHLSALPSSLSEAHSCHPLFSLLCPLCATTSLSVVKVSLAFVIHWIFFLFFFFLIFLLLLPLLLLSIYIF